MSNKDFAGDLQEIADDSKPLGAQDEKADTEEQGEKEKVGKSEMREMSWPSDWPV